MTKRVQFSGQVDVIITFTNEEYDRTAEKLAKLNYQDMLELLTMKSQWRQDMERRLAERALEESSATDQETVPSINVAPEICI